MIKKIINFYKETDYMLLLICMICSGISVYSLYAIYMSTTALSSSRTALVQLLATIAGVILASIISFMDYRNIADMIKTHSALSYGLMIATMFIGFAPEGTSNKSWIALPFGLTIQPSEVLKISMILTLAYFLNKYKNQINEVPTLTKLVFIAVIPLVFVAIQRDTGVLLVFVVIIVAMFFAAGISYKLVFACLGAGIVISPIAWQFLDDYQRNRVLGLFNPEEFYSIMFQQNMGAISIGSGQLLGKGFLAENHNITPLMYNDFIFSFIAESVGFVGICIILVLILAICFKILNIANTANDLTGSYICVGVFGMFIVQIVINIGMNLSLLPVIGVTLPLFTAGGTSVVVTYIAIGLVLSVKRHNRENLF